MEESDVTVLPSDKKCMVELRQNLNPLMQPLLLPEFHPSSLSPDIFKVHPSFFTLISQKNHHLTWLLLSSKERWLDN